MSIQDILARERDEIVRLKEQEALPDGLLADTEIVLGMTFDDSLKSNLRAAYLELIVAELPHQKWGKRLRQRQQKLHSDIAAAYDKLAMLLEQERRGSAPTRPVETTLLFKVGTTQLFPSWEVYDEVMRCRVLGEIARSTLAERVQERTDTRHKSNLNMFIDRFAELLDEAGYIHRVGSDRNTDQREITPFVLATSKLFEQVESTALKTCGFRVRFPSAVNVSAVAERIHRYGLLSRFLARKGQKAAHSA